MKIIDNIKNIALKMINTIFSDTLTQKENIIREQGRTLVELEMHINRGINEMQSILIDINKSIRVCELNGKKPEATYRNLQNAKMKIKSSIADSKTLLNQYGYKYIPRTNFTIVNLKNQDVG